MERAAMAMVSALMFLLGTLAGSSLGHSDMRLAAIQHNAAHYDARTGEFKWGPP